MRAAAVQRPPGGQRSVWVDEAGRVNLRCDRCRHHVQWRADRAVEHITGIHAAGLDRIDLADIP